MQSDLPRPEQILEELADKTAIRIERLAPVAFDYALDELIAYHRFLLELNGSSDSDGSAFSYAEIGGEILFAPHVQWIRQYRRLFERAAICMPEDDHFLRSLAYVPIRLMPGRTDAELPLNVLGAIVDLGTIMMHRVEGWITKRTVIESSDEGEVHKRLTLAGSDAKAYANVLPELMGAWEELLNRISVAYVWKDSAYKTEQENWRAYQASWPLLWKHLTNTAHCVALTVWNEDEAGAKMFCEALVRWPQNFDHRTFNEAEFQHEWLLYPNIFDFNWVEAKERASRLAYAYESEPTPNQVLANAIRGAHKDVVLLTAAILLSWSINKKKASDIGGRFAKSLLVRELYPEDVRRDSSPNFGFSELFLNLVRLDISGDRYQDDSYATYLDTLIQRLDNLTERRVVPGRAYTPSTLHDKGDLVFPFVAMLASVSSVDLENEAGNHVALLTGVEEILPEGDRSLRNVAHELGRWDSLLQHKSQELQDAIGHLLSDNTRAIRGRIALREFVEAAKSRIERVRFERLTARKIDTQKLEEICTTIQRQLLIASPGEPIFQDVEMSVDGAGELGELREIASMAVNKAQFVDPPMEQASVNFERRLSLLVKHGTSAHVWKAFCERQVELRPTRERIESLRFWDEVIALVDEVGTSPVLAVAQNAEGQRLRRLFRTSPSDWPGLVFERSPPVAPSGFYIGTLGRVRVYGGELPAGVALLFSATSLRRVCLGEIGQAGRYVDVSYEATEDIRGKLRVRVRLHCEWAESPAFKFLLPDTRES